MGEELKDEEPEIIRVGEQVLNPVWFDEDKKWYAKILHPDCGIYDEEVIALPLHSIGTTIGLERGAELSELEFNGRNRTIEYVVKKLIEENPELREANGYELSDVSAYSEGDEVRDGEDFVTTREIFMIKVRLVKYIPLTEKNKKRVDSVFGLNGF